MLFCDLYVPTEIYVINRWPPLRYKNFWFFEAKSYKITLLPETKTNIFSVRNWTKCGLNRREKYGLNFISDIFDCDSYKDINI